MGQRQYGMRETVAVADQAARDIEAWLRQLPETTAVQNVENDLRYRALDVDLLWTVEGTVYQLEVKGDRWDKTGNFFFETHSNEEKGTPGCFLYTQAHYLYYYFIQTKTLYILPMPQTREWFLQNRERFKERRTTTPIGQGHYTTVGRLVPIHAVLRALSTVSRVQL